MVELAALLLVILLLIFFLPVWIILGVFVLIGYLIYLAIANIADIVIAGLAIATGIFVIWILTGIGNVFEEIDKGLNRGLNKLTGRHDSISQQTLLIPVKVRSYETHHLTAKEFSIRITRFVGIILGCVLLGVILGGIIVLIKIKVLPLLA